MELLTSQKGISLRCAAGTFGGYDVVREGRLDESQIKPAW